MVVGGDVEFSVAILGVQILDKDAGLHVDHVKSSFFGDEAEGARAFKPLDLANPVAPLDDALDVFRDPLSP